MFAGIYYGAMYGGSTTSILLKTPGETGSVITAIEGNRMARAGRGAAALATAAIGSFVAGTHRHPAARVLRAVRSWGSPSSSGPATTSRSWSSRSSPSRAGRVLAAPRDDRLWSSASSSDSSASTSERPARLTFGQVSLLDGVDTVILIVGLFAVGEVFYVAAHQSTTVFDMLTLRRVACG